MGGSAGQAWMWHEHEVVYAKGRSAHCRKKRNLVLAIPVPLARTLATRFDYPAWCEIRDGIAKHLGAAQLPDRLGLAVK